MSRDQSTVKDRTAFLIEHRTVLIGYLYSKAKMEDWHGVSDAANDLRELEAELKTRQVEVTGNIPNMRLVIRPDPNIGAVMDRAVMDPPPVRDLIP